MRRVPIKQRRAAARVRSISGHSPLTRWRNTVHRSRRLEAVGVLWQVYLTIASGVLIY